MIVSFSDFAELDLEEIGDWIAEGNPERAVSFLSELRHLCSSLADFPLRYPVARKTAFGDVRKTSRSGYLIFYAVADTQVQILRIVHGSRDWSSIFAELE